MEGEKQREPQSDHADGVDTALLGSPEVELESWVARCWTWPLERKRANPTMGPEETLAGSACDRNRRFLDADGCS